MLVLEREVSIEEKIKRAEAIYQRRKLQGVRTSSNTVNIGNNPDFSLFKKTFVKIFFCIILYLFVYFIKNSNYFFSNDVINKANEFLSYDINLQEIYDNTSKYFGKIFYDFQKLENDNKNIEEVEKQEIIEDTNNDNSNINENDENKNDILQNNNELIENNVNDQQSYDKEIFNEKQIILGIGGSDEKINNSDDEQLSQMEIDAKYIKENFKINIPLEGIITSRFGLRTPTNIISANHAGIDIGANEGTKIKAAMDGKITLISSKGDYRKSYRNTK